MDAKLTRFILVNSNPMLKGKNLDAQTGRNIHINPLIANEIAELLISVCYGVM